MATNIPTALKSADIGRFAVRAAQLERVKPVVAYWCEYCVIIPSTNYELMSGLC